MSKNKPLSFAVERTGAYKNASAYVHLTVATASTEEAPYVILGMTNDDEVNEIPCIAPIDGWPQLNELIDMLRTAATSAFGPDGSMN